MKPKVKKIDSVKFFHVDPRQILEDVNSIPELYYLANLTMSTGYRIKINPEVALLIGQDAYSKLVNYFGGNNLYIPTKDELQSNLLGIMSYYYYNIKGYSWADVMKKLNMTPTKGSRRLLRNRWKAFKDIIDNSEDKIPDLGKTANMADLDKSDAPVRCDDTYIPKELFVKAVKTICEDLSENNVIDEESISAILNRYE